jgi:hypothetical protein
MTVYWRKWYVQRLQEQLELERKAKAQVTNR